MTEQEAIEKARIARNTYENALAQIEPFRVAWAEASMQLAKIRREKAQPAPNAAPSKEKKDDETQPG